MSYTIALFDRQLPENFEEASKIFDGIRHHEKKEIKPIFQKFHDEITKIFPCICEIEEDEDEENEGVWSDGPLINNFRGEAPVIGFSYSRLDEALPVVIEKANEMGISVLDWQDGRIHNP